MVPSGARGDGRRVCSLRRMGERGKDDAGISRRRLLQAGAGVATAAALPRAWMPAARAAAGSVSPPNLPAGIDVYREGFQNWAKSVVIDEVWTCAPRSPNDVVRLANWAHRSGWRLRPKGAMHGWSPLAITPDTGIDDPVLLADTRPHLTGIELAAEGPPAVRVSAGVSVEDLATWLEARGLGFAVLPATGDVTVGGGLAIGMHGASLPARGERRLPGQAYGSLSNQVVAFKAVVWSNSRGRYILRSFDRSHPDAKAFLVHLGRAFIVEATLRVAENQNLRCESHTGIAADELFAAPGSGGRTFESFVDASGRVEAIWFAFTERPWLKVWSVSPHKPAASRHVSAPYNYPFSDNVPEQVTDLVAQVTAGDPSVAPTLGAVEYGVAANGLVATNAADIWGPSKNTLLYIKATTLRVDEIGLAVLTSRRNLQRAIHEFTSYYGRRLGELAARGQFPINGPLEVRACGIDRPAHAGVRQAEAPAIAATTPRRDRKEWDTVIWFNSLTTSGTPGQYAFYAELERFTRSMVRGYGMLRPEWSKGWAATEDGLFRHHRGLRRTIPQSLRLGRRGDEDWDWTLARLRRYDPHGVFSNAFLDRFTG
jgi:FAD/FMN-containing dehydrogenase